MPDPKLDDLAQAFNQAVRARDEADTAAAAHADEIRAALEADRAARLAEGQAARERVLDQIAAFALKIDAVRVDRNATGLILASGARAIAFEPDGDEDGVAIAGLGGADDALSRDVDGEWMVTLHGRHLPLVPHGLADLLVHGLGLPRPPGLPSETPAPAVKRAPRLNTSIAPPRPGPRRE
jgi:hypothetical protein